MASLRRRAATGCALIVSCVLVSACTSAPFETFRGARLYASGSDALERGDVAIAIADLEKAAEFVPRASEIQNHLGLAYWAGGDFPRARAAFDRAIELDCENAAASRNRSALMRASAERAGARDDADVKAVLPGQPRSSRGAIDDE